MREMSSLCQQHSDEKVTTHVRRRYINAKYSLPRPNFVIRRDHFKPACGDTCVRTKEEVYENLWTTRDVL